MHSVVLFGDVRTHLSTVEKDLWLNDEQKSLPSIPTPVPGSNGEFIECIPEGLYFLDRAIGKALSFESLPVPPLSTERDFNELQLRVVQRRKESEVLTRDLQRKARFLRQLRELRRRIGGSLPDLSLAKDIADLGAEIIGLRNSVQRNSSLRSLEDKLKASREMLKQVTDLKNEIKQLGERYNKNATEPSSVLAQVGAEIEQKKSKCDELINKFNSSVAVIREKTNELRLTGEVKIFGAVKPEPKDQGYVSGRIHQWKLRLVSMSEGEGKRARHEHTATILSDNVTPLISNDLLLALDTQASTDEEFVDDQGELKPGFFEPRDPGNRYQVPQCPDVVVIDDRGHGAIRDLVIFKSVSPEEKPLDWIRSDKPKSWVLERLAVIKAIHAKLKDGRETYTSIRESLTSNERIVFDADMVELNLGNTAIENAELLRKYVQKWSLTNLLMRLDLPRIKSEEDHRPTMEPILICSLMGNPLNALKTKGNIYDLILSSEWLSERTIILLDAEDLRENESDPIAISTGLSWERTVQDTISGLRKACPISPINEQARSLLRFGQVIVRYGVTGALHIVRRGNDQFTYSLHFDARHDDATWSDTITKTHVFGRVAVIAASLVQSLAATCQGRHGHPFIQELPLATGDSLKIAIARSQSLARSSYGGSFEEYSKIKSEDWFSKDLFKTPQSKQKADEDSLICGSAEFPPTAVGNWSILGQHTQINLAHVASEIVNGSPSRILRYSIPVLQYDEGDKKSYVLDRREVEGYKAIEKLIRSHLERHNSQRNKDGRPLSFAVFGPPGSGKSTAVRRVIAKLKQEQMQGKDPFKEDPCTYNLAQYSSVDELTKAFDRISRIDGIPIAFFDEFDCKLPGDGDDQPLGWLKYFLAPMEDGLFRDYKLGNAILVFAGGTSSTFSEFNLEAGTQSDDQWLKFSRAKGPDFVSRLSGHLNVIGINPANPDDELYLIRRAVVVYDLLLRINKGKKSSKVSKSDGASQIDPDMVRAILHVPEYRHGARSLRMLLESCLDSSGRISVSAVPPIHQLNMLVDGKAFLSLVNNIANPKHR